MHRLDLPRRKRRPRVNSLIHVENLVKTFGEVKAVDGVSFHVDAGEILRILVCVSRRE